MRPAEILIAFAAPYLLAWMAMLVVQRQSVVSPAVAPQVAAENALGRLAPAQRRGLLLYSVPELLFCVSAVIIAIAWQPAGLNGAVLRWGLAGMALVRFSLSWPMWQDLASGKVAAIAGPLRKIQFQQRRALATEDGPIMVLPVDRTLFAAHEAGQQATIYYVPHSKRVVAVLPANSPAEV